MLLPGLARRRSAHRSSVAASVSGSPTRGALTSALRLLSQFTATLDPAQAHRHKPRSDDLETVSPRSVLPGIFRLFIRACVAASAVIAGAMLMHRSALLAPPPPAPAPAGVAPALQSARPLDAEDAASRVRADVSSAVGEPGPAAAVHGVEDLAHRRLALADEIRIALTVQTTLSGQAWHGAVCRTKAAMQTAQATRKAPAVFHVIADRGASGREACCCASAFDSVYCSPACCGQGERA